MKQQKFPYVVVKCNGVLLKNLEIHNAFVKKLNIQYVTTVITDGQH